MSALGIAIVLFAAACTSERNASDAQPSYRGSVAAVLEARCSSCHSGPTPPAGWRADTYVSAIGCTTAGTPVTIGGERSPILSILARPDHAGLLAEDERDALARWVSLGAPSTTGGVHPPTFADPRTPDGHARFLRQRRYRPMTDPADADACGRCHAGVPAPGAEGVALTAPNATACDSCHTEQGGVLACTTCHGAPGRAYPPRDACFFPDARGVIDAHAAHAGPSDARAEGLPCATCHPTPAAGAFDATHANGHVEVFFDYARAGRTARFDASTKRCTGTCHARGGTRPEITWTEAEKKAVCTDCHGAPPPDHYAGPCTPCHHEADATGAALNHPLLHLNGKVDLGDGSGRCGACHGSGDDPWPKTGAHAAHAAPSAARPVLCETCHTVPAPNDKHPVGRGAARVELRGLATQGGSRATFDARVLSCANTYCHAGKGAANPTPTWTDPPRPAATCGGCHAVPPPPPHSPMTSCGAAASCHGGIPDGRSFTPAGKATHVDGRVTRSIP